MADSLSVGNLSVSGGLTRLTGTSSKLDTESIVEAAYKAKRLPAVRLEGKVSQNEAKIAALGELNGLLGTLKQAVNGLRNPGPFSIGENVFETKQAFFSSNTTTRPDELLGVTLENKTLPGRFDVTVERLATAHKLSGRQVAAADQKLADAWNAGSPFAGTLEIGLAGGTKASIAVNGEMDIHDLRAAINGVSAQTGVSATVLKVSDGDYRLMLTGKETGKAIELTDAGGAGITALLGTTEVQPAQTALVRVDGVAIERSTNKIDDVMTGMTLDLYKAEPGTTVTVQVEPSLAEVKERIVSFVDAYNALRDFAAKHAAVGEGGKVSPDAVLFGDRTLRSSMQALSGIVSGAVAGLGPSVLSTLRDVGISFDEASRLKIDEKALDAKLLARLDDVRRVFEFSSTSSSPDLSVTGRTNALAGTAFRVAISDPDGDGKADAATIDGHAAEVAGGIIRGAAGTPYEGLKLSWVGKGDATVDITVSQGIADKLYNALEETLNLSKGPIQKAIEELGGANKAYATQIAQIDERAQATRARLIEKFTAMESALSLANTMLTQVRAQMDAMNGSN